MMKVTIGLLGLFLLAGVAPVSAALEDYFVNSAWLAENRGQVVVLDVRKGPLYLLGHIDGALHVERDAFLETRGQVKSLVPRATDFVKLMERLGVTRETQVVVYAEDDNPYAARMVWTLRYHGHERAYVLDGGYQKWSAEKRATAMLPTAAPQLSRYELAAKPGAGDIRAEGDYLLTRIEHPAVVIWDTRSEPEYAGKDVRADRGGHIPGAVHFNWTDLQTEVEGVKVLKSKAEIEALLAQHGISRDKEILAHCQTGIRSSYATLVLLGLGYERVKNYDGSWIEWANTPALPIVSADGTINPVNLTKN